jgi:hypothetical protein
VLGRGGQGGQSVPRGARLTVQCILPETEGIIIDFRSLLAANPALLPELRFPDGVYTTDGVTTLATFEFYFDGSAWVYEDATIPS